MTSVVLRADAGALPLPEASVDLVVTSPPYWSLPSYTDAGGVCYDGQIGSEATPAEYLAAMWECTAEWMRVLKPQGSLWVNLGDKYATSRRGPDGSSSGLSNGPQHRPSGQHPRDFGVARKSLVGLPWRYAIGCIDDLGLILRAEVVWSKPNALPESVTDRVRRTHEQWFHFTKQSDYFSAVDEIREPHAAPTRSHGARAMAGRNTNHPRTATSAYTGPHPLGALPGSVWDIPSQPLKVPADLGVDHYAAYPTEWPRRIITGWSPAGICQACGQGRRPVRGVDWDRVPHRIEQRRRLTDAQVDDWCARFATWCQTAGVTRRELDAICASNGMGRHWTNPGRAGAQIPTPAQWQLIRARLDPPADLDELVDATVDVPVALADHGSNDPIRGRHATTGPRVVGIHTITGHACDCPDTTAPTRPAVVLDPFGGTGTTALAASVLGRIGISIDRSADYCRIATWRTTDPHQRARVLGTRPTAAAVEGPLQLTLDTEATA
jgi:DNA modification methylase